MHQQYGRWLIEWLSLVARALVDCCSAHSWPLFLAPGTPKTLGIGSTEN